jgi:hypothetical protein
MANTRDEYLKLLSFIEKTFLENGRNLEKSSFYYKSKLFAASFTRSQLDDNYDSTLKEQLTGTVYHYFEVYPENFHIL